jgi:hypothetical protein
MLRAAERIKKQSGQLVGQPGLRPPGNTLRAAIQRSASPEQLLALPARMTRFDRCSRAIDCTPLTGRSPAASTLKDIGTPAKNLCKSMPIRLTLPFGETNRSLADFRS